MRSCFFTSIVIAVALDAGEIAGQLLAAVDLLGQPDPRLVPRPVGEILQPGQRPVDAGRRHFEPVRLLDRIASRRTRRRCGATDRRNRRSSAGACRAARPSPAASGRRRRRTSSRARDRSRALAPRARSIASVGRCRPCDGPDKQVRRRKRELPTSSPDDVENVAIDIGRSAPRLASQSASGASMSRCAG